MAILDKLVPTLCNGSQVGVNFSGPEDKNKVLVFNRRSLFDGEWRDMETLVWPNVEYNKCYEYKKKVHAYIGL